MKYILTIAILLCATAHAAFTERYVTSAAGGGGDGSSGTPWTLSEALTNAAAGDRVNIQSDSGYSIGADTVTNAGTASSYIVFRGYDSSIGDLEANGRNADGTLNTTGFPVITFTGALTPNSYIVFESITFESSAVSATGIISSTAVDNFALVSCSMTNTSSGTGRCIIADNGIVLINCDFTMTDNSRDIIVSIDNRAVVVGCRFDASSSSAAAALLDCELPVIIDCVFLGNGTNTDGVQVLNWSQTVLIQNCTFYGLDVAIEGHNSLPGYLPPILINNHVTDCDEYFNNPYSGTANVALIETNNRTRDVNTLRTGAGDGLILNAVTTDTGGAETDYTAAGSDNFYLISGAPGEGTGLIPYTDIGAYQTEMAEGGSGAIIIAPRRHGN